jgi:hypothetical protein
LISVKQRRNASSLISKSVKQRQKASFPTCCIIKFFCRTSYAVTIIESINRIRLLHTYAILRYAYTYTTRTPYFTITIYTRPTIHTSLLYTLLYTLMTRTPSMTHDPQRHISLCIYTPHPHAIYDTQPATPYFTMYIYTPPARHL